jgi:hypothetical protein
MAGRVRIITSLWRTGDDRTLPLLPSEWIKSSVERLSEKGSERGSEGEFGRNEVDETGRKEPSLRSLGLRHGSFQGFSDSLWKENLRPSP